jgi:LPPG:FO 2-phospho-L-lactate transferase
VIAPHDVTALVNTGDDTELHGLWISPDIDTVIYTLAGAIDPDRGWGLQGESWNAMETLRRYGATTPPGSSAGTTWFNLGDRDLATHLYRTGRRDEGASLSEITDEIARAWGVEVRVVPMTDDRVETRVTVVGEGEISFQEYFVQRRHEVPVEALRFEGAESAVPNLGPVCDADLVVIAPSNPLVSIGPIRHLSGVDAWLSRRRSSVVAISPIVGGAALKGPADRMMRELGLEPSVVGVAELYAPIASTLVIDHADSALRKAVEATGMKCVVTDTIMATPQRAAALARVACATSERD